MLQQGANKTRFVCARLSSFVVPLILAGSLLACGSSTILQGRSEASPKVLGAEGIAPPQRSGLLVGLKLTPVYVKAEEQPDGWTDYAVILAVENVSDQLLYLPGYLSGRATVEASGDGAYEGKFEIPPGARYIPLPPHFRLSGIVDQSGERKPIRLSFRAPATANLIRATVEDTETIELKPIQLTFPTDVPPEAFYNQGEIVELSGTVSLTMGHAFWEHDDSGQTLTVPITFQNSDKQRELAFSFRCFLLDGWGYFYTGEFDGARPSLRIEPGQTSEYRVSFPFGDNRASLTEAKLLCGNEREDVLFIFNVSLS